MTPETLSSAKVDLILHNGRFATLDPRKPTAQAVAMRDGKFVAVGDGRRGAQVCRRPHPDHRRRRAGDHPRPKRLAPAPDPRRAQLQPGTALGRRAQPGRRPADAPGAGRGAPRRRNGCASSAAGPSSSSPSGGMPTLDEINAAAPGHAGVRAAPLRPRPAERSGTAGLRLHQGHARSARRRNPARRRRQSHRAADRPAQRHDPVRHAGQGTETAAARTRSTRPASSCANSTGWASPAPSTPAAASRTTPTTTGSSRTCTDAAR